MKIYEIDDTYCFNNNIVKGMNKELNTKTNVIWYHVKESNIIHQLLESILNIQYYIKNENERDIDNAIELFKELLKYELQNCKFILVKPTKTFILLLHIIVFYIVSKISIYMWSDIRPDLEFIIHLYASYYLDRIPNKGFLLESVQRYSFDKFHNHKEFMNISNYDKCDFDRLILILNSMNKYSFINDKDEIVVMLQNYKSKYQLPKRVLQYGPVNNNKTMIFNKTTRSLYNPIPASNCHKFVDLTI